MTCSSPAAWVAPAPISPQARRSIRSWTRETRFTPYIWVYGVGYASEYMGPATQELSVLDSCNFAHQPVPQYARVLRREKRDGTPFSVPGDRRGGAGGGM